MRSFSYSSDLTGGSLLVRESRVVADLLMLGVEADAWHSAIVDDNRLQKRSCATACKQARIVRRRLEHFGPSFWRVLRDGDDELATQTAFCAALKRNLLLVEFLEIVVGDAFLVRSESLAAYQWLDFLEERAARDPCIAALAEVSRKKMGQVVFRMMAEVGLIDSTRTRRLQHMRLRPELRVLLEESGRDRIISCLSALSVTPA